MTGRETARRAVHLAMGAGAFFVPVLGWRLLALLCALAALGNAFVLPRLPATRWLVRPTGGGGRTGLVLYPVAVLLLCLLFQDRAAPIQGGWVALAVGDGLAPFYGRLLPRPRWPWRRDKSLAASAAAFGTAGLVLFLLVPWAGALGAAIGGALGDSAPPRLDDNLAVSLLAGFGTAVALGWPA